MRVIVTTLSFILFTTSAAQAANECDIVATTARFASVYRNSGGSEADALSAYWTLLGNPATRLVADQEKVMVLKELTTIIIHRVYASDQMPPEEAETKARASCDLLLKRD